MVNSYEVPESLGRTELLLGNEALKRLHEAHVLVVGVGGVGGSAALQLVRMGIGKITVVDDDVVAMSNINRQVVAYYDTVGQPKVRVFADMAKRINPTIEVTVKQCYLDEQNVSELLMASAFDFVVDAIDTVQAKVALITESVARGIPVVTSMGAGAKLDDMAVQLSPLGKTYGCGLAKAVRDRMKRQKVGREVWQVPALFSPEPRLTSAVQAGSPERGKQSTVGTISYMPNLFGLHLSAYVVKRLLGL